MDFGADKDRIASVYGQVIHDIPDGVLLLDPESLSILDANPAFANLVGISVAQCRQRTLHDFDDHPEAEFEEAVSVLREKGRINLPRWRFCGEAECFYAQVLISKTTTATNSMALAVLHPVSTGAIRMTRSLEDDVVDYGDLRADIREALARDAFQLVYQPIMSYAPSARAVGAEALLRWDHPEFGRIPPNAFIHQAEQTGRMPELDRWVIRTALRQLRTWRENYPEIGISVNVSAESFADPAFPVWIRGFTDDLALPRDAVTLELSGAILRQDPDRVVEGMGLLREMGLRVALDDFGMVDTSADLVRALNIDVVKLDRSFITGVARNEAEKDAVKSLCRLLNDTDCEVMAVGVETQEQLDFLRSLEIMLFQGFYFQRAVPPANLSSYFYFAASRS